MVHRCIQPADWASAEQALHRASSSQNALLWHCMRTSTCRLLLLCCTRPSAPQALQGCKPSPLGTIGYTPHRPGDTKQLFHIGDPADQHIHQSQHFSLWWLRQTRLGE